jgi:RNA polymerase sigma-70 factor (family 1)
MRDSKATIYSNSIFVKTMTQDGNTDDFTAVKKGDVKAYEYIFKKYYQRLCNYAVVLLKDTAESEEVVQQVFINIWNKREMIEIETSLQSYLYRAVNNAGLNRLKQLKTQRAHHEHFNHERVSTAESTLQSVSKNELEKSLYAAVDRLPEQCRLTFQLSRFEGLKYQEIANELNVSVKTVENQVGKALKFLREELREFLPILLIYLPSILF